jgi:hypothetical protein
LNESPFYDNSILDSSEKSNPQKGGHASMNVPAERAAAENTAAGASGELETRESVEEAKAMLVEAEKTTGASAPAA